jgi:acetyl esterase
MFRLQPHENHAFHQDPIEGVDHHDDIDYVGDGIRAHRLDVLTPRGFPAPLPVYVYFHGGGWTSGDKHPLTKYCASQAVEGMIVVNVNYRMAGRFHMHHLLHDANDALAWVRDRIAEFGGDPHNIVLAGDSAGGQIAALVAALSCRPELAEHYEITPALQRASISGLVLHCSALDFSVLFERGFIMGLGFVRMLLPGKGKGLTLVRASRWLSPIEWLDDTFPPVLITTSERDFFYKANLNFAETLRRHGVPAQVMVFPRAVRNAEHTWQQNYRYPESQAVYRRLQRFVRSLTASAGVSRALSAHV